MDPIIGAAIGASASTLNNVFDFFGQHDTNKTNMELAKYQNEFNLQMWERQNEYNNPTNTMQRLTEAGINPRAYQQIGQFANATNPQPAVAPQYQSPLSQVNAYTEALSDYFDVKIKQEQLLNMEQQRNLQGAQALYFGSRNVATEMQNALSAVGYDIYDAFTGKRIEQMFGYRPNSKYRGNLLNKDKSVAADAYFRALINRMVYKQHKEDFELGITGNGLESLAKGLLRNAKRFGEWTWDMYKKQYGNPLDYLIK